MSDAAEIETSAHYARFREVVVRAYEHGLYDRFTQTVLARVFTQDPINTIEKANKALDELIAGEEYRKRQTRVTKP